ncbi:uncharacterized protein LOC126896171 isoform X2 [Daktulosphaira vitifoliae]|uniref:uncharacterized protein LOC126896171 isoform X2 n=1 Tax=Daktulosphaira vitifoliae TaxID=58002 RepID=UPI0021A9EC7F|nr:uncharacterized protein LOC126896171 isoform X2 [Daktulosphaira vitifoliae]
MYYTNYMLEKLDSTVPFRLFSFMEYMCENTQSTHSDTDYSPKGNDINDVLIREKIIRQNLTLYFINKGKPIEEPENYIYYEDIKTTLLKQYQNRYTLMEKIYNISEDDIVGLKENTLINRRLKPKDNENCVIYEYSIDK